mmetsp:Transcript_10165/g.18255  ORF Transcript_10165/g.18255 Transcript_10165/m.18255 type:complete len:607 (+) Transcript_10165:201-2021(+)|eukprot:CAMPEP_0201630434 /NCGR_PEP_ID=MMETSP0493-20130528/4758_1 /ASSEMBLY_ACC=CAM_ASM_000838 /TAXON_ID=420259 /ORGANISM="Thalassiosira gravida, Strain GMp14c1" /LENGTH=606 /DNA_ID=CAMNT_0048101597 /DNA_START=55 /DNA_END=1875 /DNA_ORIENTATION=+
MDELITADTHLRTVCDQHERDLKATIEKLDQEKRILVERLNKLDDKKLETTQTHGDVDAADDDVIEVNAGGTIVSAKRSTLTRLRGTRMEALFSGRWDKMLQRDNDNDNNGCLFLDINGVCFRAIVDYLNEITISSEDDPPDPPTVDDEHSGIFRHQLEFFGILDHVETTGEMPDSNIIKEKEHVMQLHDWLKENDSDGDFRLLYRSSRDDDTATGGGSNFHSKCDDQGCTITIIETSDGFVFGGYSNTSWASSGGWSKADKAFLFVLSGIDIDRPHKMGLKNPNDGKAVYYSLPHGPIFGEGLDLFVNGSEVYLKSGVSYELGPSGQLTPNNDGLCNTFIIKEIEVLQVIGSSCCRPDVDTNDVDTNAREEGIEHTSPVNRFTEDINEAINAKQESLVRAETEILLLEGSFNDECNFINAIASGDAKEMIALNVSGTIMITTRSTLQAIEDSVLAQQFDDSKWTDQGGCSSRSVKEWSPGDVRAWAESIGGIPENVVNSFEENEITGRELLALGIGGLKSIGVKRAGTVYLLVDEIKKLKKLTLIEHSPYCFGKILDYLRLKQLYSKGLLSEELALPTICDSQKNRFEKVVKYYFPGDSAYFILG